MTDTADVDQSDAMDIAVRRVIDARVELERVRRERLSKACGVSDVQRAEAELGQALAAVDEHGAW